MTMMAETKKKDLTVLVKEHSYGNSAHVKPVQEVLHVLAGYRVSTICLLILYHSLCHCGHHIIMPAKDLDHCICETSSIMK